MAPKALLSAPPLGASAGVAGAAHLQRSLALAEVAHHHGVSQEHLHAPPRPRV